MNKFPVPLKAVLFDLDGVLTDTARAHFLAWKRLADERGIPFDLAANEELKGVDRMKSLDFILARGTEHVGDDKRPALADRKNGWYLAAIADFAPSDLLPGARAGLLSIRQAGLPIALCSASRNAPKLLERLGINDLFDTVVDPMSVERGKPAPDIFLAAAGILGAPPERCLGIEDAASGIAAIRAAGMRSIGIGDPQTLAEADVVLPSLAEFRLEDYHDAG